MAPASNQRIDPPIGADDQPAAVAPVSPDQITEAFPLPALALDPPIGAGELAAATAPVSPAPAPEELPAPALSVDAVAGTVGATLRDAAPWLRRLGQLLLALLALYAIGWLLVSAAPALTPFMIGLVLAYLLMPVVDRLAQRMPRWAAILLVYIGGIGLLAGSIAFILPPAIDQVQQLFGSIPDADRLLKMWNDFLQEYRAQVPASVQQPIDRGIGNAIQTAQANLAGYLQGAGGFILGQVLNVLNTLTFLIGFLIIPIWLFYVLNDRSQAAALVDRLLPPRARPDFWNIWGLADDVFSDYIRGQLLLGLAVGTMVGLGLLLLRLLGFDVRYILLLAIVAGITELIPIIGPIIGAIPGVLVGFFGGDNGLQAGLAVLAVYIVVQQLENNLLVPRIIGESVGVHPAILTVILIAMGQVFGLLGVVLAAPLTAIARDLFVYVYRRLDGLSPAAARHALSSEGPGKEAAMTPG